MLESDIESRKLENFLMMQDQKKGKKKAKKPSGSKSKSRK